MLVGFLIVGTEAPDWIPAGMIGEIGLWAAAALTLITGYDYLAIGMRHMIEDTNRTTNSESGSSDSVGTPRGAA